MQVLKAVSAAAVLLVMALAGCAGSKDGDSGSGFSIKGPDAEGTYTFTATASADNYSWDLGDHLTRLEGKKVEHTYDFENGVAQVVLSTKKGDERKDYRREITLGTGVNEIATFVLEGSTNWTTLGETFSLSAHRSTDPDGDPLRYTWSCQRVSDAIRQSPHAHAGFGGVPFGSPPAGAVTSVNAQGPLPAADRVVEGDFCDGLGPGGRPTLDTTIAGSFVKSGVYDIYLLASDPVHPTTSGKYRIVATPPEDKPNEIQSHLFNGTFKAGSDGVVQGICGTPQPCTESFDQVTHSFTLSLLGQAGFASLSYADPTGQMDISCAIKRGTADVATVSGPGGNVTLDPITLKAASYGVTCEPTAGIPSGPDGTSYTLRVVVDLDMDPFKVY